MNILLPLAGFVLFASVSFAAETNTPDAKLKDTLENARAVPYVDPATGKVKGYVVESKTSNNKDFKKMKIRQGDVLTGVNELSSSEKSSPERK